MATNKTRYAVISAVTGKTLKNAETRAQARLWKNGTGRGGLAIFDRQRNAIIR